MKRLLFFTVLLFVSLTGLFADDGEGRVFHFRPMFRVDPVSVADHLIGDGIGLKQDRYLSGSLTLDFLFYRNGSFRLGPRIDLGINIGRDCPSYSTFSLGFHLETGGFYTTIGFQTNLVAGDNTRFGWWDGDGTDNDGYLSRYNWTSFWLELGYLLKIGGSPSGLVFDFGVSCLPMSIWIDNTWDEEEDWDTDDDYGGVEILGPIFFETFHVFVGIGYTF